MVSDMSELRREVLVDVKNVHEVGSWLFVTGYLSHPSENVVTLLVVAGK
jgi:hypothetical protein